MEHALTWEDVFGVVHAVTEDADPTYASPRALLLVCRINATWLNGRDGHFGHVQSGEIRAAARFDPVTCLACIIGCGG